MKGNIQRLRKKIEPDPHSPEYILNGERGTGLKILIMRNNYLRAEVEYIKNFIMLRNYKL